MVEHTLTISGFSPFKMDLDPAFPQDAHLITFLNDKILPERDVINLMVRVLKPGDTAVDGGASIGFLTMFMARLVGETGTVIAFEPDSRAVCKLAKNCHLNGFDNVIIHASPLWDSSYSGQTFYEAVDSGSSSLRNVRGNAPTCHIMSSVCLDDYLRAPPKLIKLDVEGAEQHALEGAGKILAPYVICELNDNNLCLFERSASSLRAMMHEHGYYTFLLSEHGGLPCLVPPKTEVSTVLKRTEEYQVHKDNVNVLFASIESVGDVWGLVDGT